jgi:hypothetical protein
MQYNTVRYQTGSQSQPPPQEQQAPSSFTLSSLLGLRIGQDTTGNFALTPAGLAVLGRDSRYYSFESYGERARLLDVTSLILPINPGVYRIPALEVRPGDLILISDSPFSALFVIEIAEFGIVGLEATCNELVTYFPPENLFGDRFFGHRNNIFVRIVSTFDLLEAVIGRNRHDNR